MKRNFIILCLGVLLSSCSMYWTDGSVPNPKGDTDSQDQKSIEERVKEQKDLYSSVGLGDEGSSSKNGSYDLLYVGEEENDQNVSNNLNTTKAQAGQNEDDEDAYSDWVLEIDEGDGVRTEVVNGNEGSKTSQSGSEENSEELTDTKVTNGADDDEEVVIDFDPNLELDPDIPGQPFVGTSDQSQNEASSQPNRVIDAEVICKALEYVGNNFNFLPEYKNEKLNLITNLQAAHSYFCNNNGLNQAKLRMSSYDGVNNDESSVYVDKIFDKITSFVVSHAAFGTATRENETTLDSYDYVNKNYCSTFERYSEVYGREYVKDIEKLEVLSRFSHTTKNVQETSGCSYHLVSSKIAGLLSPEYNGVSFLSKFLGGNLLIEVNYIIKPIDLIKDLLTVTIAYKDQEGFIQSFSYRYSSATTGGIAFHDKFVGAFTNKAQEITRNRLLALKRVTSKMKSGEFK